MKILYSMLENLFNSVSRFHILLFYLLVLLGQCFEILWWFVLLYLVFFCYLVFLPLEVAFLLTFFINYRTYHLINLLYRPFSGTFNQCDNKPTQIYIISFENLHFLTYFEYAEQIFTTIGITCSIFLILSKWMIDPIKLAP